MNEPTPNEAEQRDSSRAHLIDMFERHWSVMLFNHAPDGRLAGRPMARERVDADGTVYFATGMDSEKIKELQKDPQVTLSIQSAHEYAVMSGTAEVSQDPSLIDELWKDSWSVWFPLGRQDPSIAIVVVTPEEGTYWDQTKSQGLSFLFRMVKARILGKEVEIDPGDSRHVTLAS